MSFEEQIMSKDKYPSTFLRQMETIVFIIFQIFFAPCAVLKIGCSPVLAGHIQSCDMLRQITHKRKYLMVYNAQCQDSRQGI